MAGTDAVKVTGVLAVAIPVRDQDAALAFYTGVLGCEVVTDEVVGPGFRWVEVGAGGGAVGIALIAPEEGVPAGIDTGIRLAVQDATAAHAALRGAGVDVGELLLWTGAPPMFGFADPDGNRLYLVEDAGPGLTEPAGT
jgi:catechol 2,3-dioxygenase-like lactoylglutathione lyase family enzyme